MKKVEALKHNKSKLETGKVYEVTDETAEILVKKKFAKYPKEKK